MQRLEHGETGSDCLLIAPVGEEALQGLLHKAQESRLILWRRVISGGKFQRQKKMVVQIVKRSS